MAELIDRLAKKYSCEVHLYAQRVDDLAVELFSGAGGSTPGQIFWHRIPRMPGPHLVSFLFWLFANRVARMWDKLAYGLKFDLVFSPGINALKADIVMAHVVFQRLRELQDARADRGLRGLHRSLYYRLVCSLERHVYENRSIKLAAVSKHTADQLKYYFGRGDVTVVPYGVDLTYFSAAVRQSRREEARKRLGYSADHTVLLLVGNDLRNKGLAVVLEALGKCRKLPLRLCVVTGDALSGAAAQAVPADLQERVKFLGETPDILPVYAAADIYVAPSLEDSFNLPALEMMACGLPVVVSRRAGISDYLRDGQDGILLRDPEDAEELANVLKRLLDTPGLSAKIGEQAVATAAALSWDRHAEIFAQMLN